MVLQILACLVYRNLVSVVDLSRVGDNFSSNHGKEKPRTELFLQFRNSIVLLRSPRGEACGRGISVVGSDLVNIHGWVCLC